MKIYRILTTLVLATLLFAPVQAQDEYRHEVGLSYGAAPNSIWIDFLSDVIPAFFGQKTANSHYVGPIGLEYYYHTSPLIGLGGIFTYVGNNEDLYNKEEVKVTYRSRNYYTLMPSIKFNWLRKQHWGMYSKLAAGATLAHFNDKDYVDNGNKKTQAKQEDQVLFNFQASLLGIEAGSQQVRGFIELGMGEQGVFMGGLRCKF